MPAYFPSSINELDYSLSSLKYNSQSTINIGFLQSNTSFAYRWSTPVFYPNSTTAPSGTATAVIQHTVVNMTINITASVERINSAGDVLATGTVSALQAVSSTNTFTLSYPSWVGASCSDRLSLRLTYSVGIIMSIQSCETGLDRVGTYLLTNLTHNGVGCTVLRKPTSVTGYEK